MRIWIITDNSRHATKTRALSEQSLLRYITFAALYVAQGLPLGLLVMAIPAHLAGRGAGTGQVGQFLAIATLPWGLKLVWGPFMDRYGYLPMGRRRPWVLVAQFGLVLSVSALAFVRDPLDQLASLTAVGFLMSVFSSMQDVATDGMAIDALPDGERARANALMAMGQAGGMVLAAAGGGALLSHYGLAAAASLMAGILTAILLWTLSVRERPGERLLPWSPGQAHAQAIELQTESWLQIVTKLLRVMLLPMSLLAIVAIFVWEMTGGVFLAFAPTLVVGELGWEETEFETVGAIAMAIAALVGGILVGPLIDRVGPLRVARTVAGLSIVGALTAGFLPQYWTVRPAWILFMVVGAILTLAVFISFLTIAMGMCWRQVAATQFAIYMAIANLGKSAGSAVAGRLDAILTNEQMFFAGAASAGVFLIMLCFLDLTRHQRVVKTLDAPSQVRPDK